MSIKVRKAADGKLKQQIDADGKTFVADAPASSGGDDAGPSPHELLDAALGACTALTVTMVAQRKQWPLRDVRVQITHDEVPGAYTLHRRIELVGDLDAAQREYLLGIANKCPIHKVLTGAIAVHTEMTDLLD